MASVQSATLTILSGAQNSEALEMRNVREFSIQAPATLTGTVTVESGSTASGFTTVQSPPGTDITPAASKTTVLTSAPFQYIRLHSGVAEAADRVFTMWLVIGE